MEDKQNLPLSGKKDINKMSTEQKGGLSRRGFLKFLGLSGITLAASGVAVGAAEAFARSRQLPTQHEKASPKQVLTLENGTELERQKMLHGITDTLGELTAIDKMTPKNGVKVGFEIITAFTVGWEADKQRFEERNLELSDRNNLHTSILEAKKVINFANKFLAENPTYTEVQLQVWLRRQYGFTVNLQNSSGTVDTYDVAVTSTFSPDWENVPNITEGGLIRPQDKDFDFTVTTVALGQQIQTLGVPVAPYSFSNGFDIGYDASPNGGRKYRFLTGERRRTEATKAELHFIEDFIVPALAKDESNLLKEDVVMALTL